ncbi:MAG TPA: S8 family serine peptidase [Thermoanaerobaculia bacterium]|nr:S8 family serine peptidase [Thermoanaerobaculia bacterium]
MSKHFHITINEGATLVRRRGANPSTARSGSDPGYDYVVPDPEDPDYPYVVPDPEDPDYPYVVPDPEDPSGVSAPGWPMAGQVAGVVYASQGPEPTACGCCCGHTDAKPTTPPRPGLSPRDYSGFVIVRMAQGLKMDYPTLWHLANGDPSFPALKAVLELKLKSEEGQGEEKRSDSDILDSRPLIELSARRLKEETLRAAVLRNLQELESKAALTPFPPLHSLALYWRVDLRPHPERVEEVVAALNALAEVDLAYRELTADDPKKKPQEDPPQSPPPDPIAGSAFAEDQGYLNDAPAGINASWAWTQLAGVTYQLKICDLEQGWCPGHDDLKLTPEDPIYGANRAVPSKGGDGKPGHHGTAVLGQLAATGGGGLGVTGAAAKCGQFLMASHYKSKDEKEGTAPNLKPHPFAGTNGHVAAAIAQALVVPTALGPGDVLLLEVQRGLRPTEIDPADLDAIRLASALGVVVVEAAGNGGFDLDAYVDPDTGLSLRRGDSRFRDSGAILVGASRSAVPHNRAPFSNYGSRLDCYAWGEAVTSCGYGDLAGTVDVNLYTNTFSGTSSASPIIAGAAALVQALHQKAASCWLAPLAMRQVLSDPATGTRQGPNVAGFIGVMPDLKAIVRGQLQLVPDIYLRRHLCDDGSRRATSTEVSSSPDILLWDGQPTTETASGRFGEGLRANQPAPGTPLNLTNPAALVNRRLYVRLRNRGGDSGAARVQLFISPAATLITPERWVPIGALDLTAVPRGDTLTLSGPHDWATALARTLAADGSQLQMPPALPAEPLSFLAVLRPAAASVKALGFEWASGLPPGPPYFDWTEYRTFLHSRSVAWRNAHRVLVPQSGPASLDLLFLFAGTPDHARHFDFEVIQRLPAGTRVELQAGGAFAAKLRQRQPALVVGKTTPPDADMVALLLPTRPRLTLGPVSLAPKVRIPGRFVIPDPSALSNGHSLAIRQLWKGEEVGRITWWFVDKP